MNNRLKHIVFLWFFLFSFSVGQLPSAFASSEPILHSKSVRIGVLAKRGKKQAEKKWGPMVLYLSEIIPGAEFSLVPLGFDEINTAVKNKEIDFVLVNSAMYVGLEHDYGVKRIATLKNKRINNVTTQFGGVIFCRADRQDIRDCSDLRDLRFMAVDKRSFGGWLMAWFHLITHGVDPQKHFSSLEFGGTHDAVVYAVKEGDVDVGTVRTDTLERMAKEGKININNFHVIDEHTAEEPLFPFLLSTQLYPEWPMASLKHGDRVLSEKVTIALLQMHPESEAAQAAHIDGWTVALSYQPVHDCLKKLGVGPYVNWGKITWQQALIQYWYWVCGVIFILVFFVIGAVVQRNLNKRLKAAVINADKEISQRKKVEMSLSRIKFTLDQIHDCVLMFDPETLQYIYVNQGMFKQLGYSEKEVLAMTPVDLKSDYTEQSFRDMIAPLKEGTVSIISYETSHWHKDNYAVPVDIQTQYIKQESGEGIFVSVVRDISTRKKEEEEYRRLFESSRDAIVVTTEKGFVDCNSAALEMFGYASKKEFMSLKPGDVSPMVQPGGGNSHELASQQIADAIENNVAFFPWVHRRKDGTDFSAEVLLSPFERDGHTVVQGVVRDLTERNDARKKQEKLQSQLLHAQKLESVGQLAAGIAHEINTPTQYVGTNIDFLAEAHDDIVALMKQFLVLLAEAKEHNFSPELVKEAEELLEELDWHYLAEEIPVAIEQSRDGVQRVTSIVRAMKEFSHPGSKDKSDTDLNKIINTTITVARNEWKYVADVETDLDENLPSVSCLSDEMGQVLLNLLVNAAHAIAEKLGKNPEGEKGLIFITSSHSDSGVEVRIKDNGNGIPESARERIFDPFYTTKKVGSGTGQGLAIAYDVVTGKHDGTLTFETESGVGTTFIICLPV